VACETAINTNLSKVGKQLFQLYYLKILFLLHDVKYFRNIQIMLHLWIWISSVFIPSVRKCAFFVRMS